MNRIEITAFINGNLQTCFQDKTVRSNHIWIDFHHLNWLHFSFEIYMKSCLSWILWCELSWRLIMCDLFCYALIKRIWNWVIYLIMTLEKVHLKTLLNSFGQSYFSPKLGLISFHFISVQFGYTIKRIRPYLSTYSFFL